AEAVTLADFTAAIERIVAGLEKKSRVLGQEERRRVAYHEMGHALVAASLPGVDPVHKVSIIPRGIGALRYTTQRPTQHRCRLAHDGAAWGSFRARPPRPPHPLRGAEGRGGFGGAHLRRRVPHRRGRGPAARDRERAADGHPVRQGGEGGPAPLFAPAAAVPW